MANRSRLYGGCSRGGVSLLLTKDNDPPPMVPKTYGQSKVIMVEEPKPPKPKTLKEYLELKKPG